MIVFDTETTAMVAPEAAPVGQQPRIVEFAAIKLNPFTLEEEGRFQCLINPRIPIPPDASEVHGITDEMVKAKCRHLKMRGRCLGVAIWDQPIRLLLFATQPGRSIRETFPCMLVLKANG